MLGAGPGLQSQQSISYWWLCVAMTSYIYRRVWSVSLPHSTALAVDVCPELHGICGGKCPWVFNAHIAHDLDPKTVELSAKRVMKGRLGFVQVKK